MLIILFGTKCRKCIGTFRNITQVFKFYEHDGFEVLTAVTTKNTVFWDVKMCSFLPGGDMFLQNVS
jgi:hypothetical protein